jgi:hypothetical protein
MGLLRMAARTAVVAGTATAVSGRVQRRQAGRYQAQDEQQYAQQAPMEPVQPQQDDQMAKLKELAGMHDQGVLTDDEFTAAKAKLLGI